MRRLRRVLYLVNLDPTKKFGSLEEQVLILAREFKVRGSLLVPVFNCPMEGTEADVYHSAQLPVEALDLNTFSFSKMGCLLQLIRKYDIEVLHWNFFQPMNPFAMLLKIKRPLVAHFITDHNSRTGEGDEQINPVKRVAKRWLFRVYSNVLCVSDYVQRDLDKQQVWKSLSRVHHFINTDRFRPDQTIRADLRDRLGVGNRFVMLVIAYLIPEKGVEVALKALQFLPPQVGLWIVGDGPQRSVLELRVKELRLEDRVVFCGQHFNVAPYVQAADCFVCPSLWGEAAGLVILEAMGCGLPVVASDVGGIPEFVQENATGYLFPAGDPEALAERVGRLIGGRERAQTMGEYACTTARQRFSVEVQLPNVLRFYEV